EESDRVRGLSTGADDYLVKPFSTPEFIARVRALLRRAKPEVLSSVLKVGDIILDREAHRVYRKKSEIKLGPTEFRLLEFMMQHPGRVFSRSQLLDNVWARRSISTSVPSTCMSAGCARRSTTAACPTSSAPSAAPATPSVRPDPGADGAPG